MAWIETHQGLYFHPKTLHLAKLMKWDVDRTAGKLQRLWLWCMDYAPDGDLRTTNASDIGAAILLPDVEAKKFINAMVKTHWLDKEPYLRVHNWWKYTGLFMQRKYSRTPQIWQKIRDSYVPQANTSAIELDESCSCTPAMEEADCSTNPAAQPNSCNSTPAVQQEACDSTPTVQLDSCSCTPPNLTKPNQTLSDKTKQNQQQQPNSAAAAKNREAEGPDRQQQNSTHTRPPIAGILADSAGPGNSRHIPPIPATPENDLEQIIYDRIGRQIPLSRADVEKLIVLKNRHGPRFYDACESLHGRVTNAANYLASILEPEDKVEKMVAEVKELLRAESAISIALSGGSHA